MHRRKSRHLATNPSSPVPRWCSTVRCRSNTARRTNTGARSARYLWVVSMPTLSRLKQAWRGTIRNIRTSSPRQIEPFMLMPSRKQGLPSVGYGRMPNQLRLGTGESSRNRNENKKVDMCGRFALNENPQKFAEYFNLSGDLDLSPSWNIAPSPRICSIIMDEKGERHPHRMRWGLIPSW